MTLHDWGHKVIYVFYQRLTHKLFLSVKKSYVCVCWTCACVRACMGPSILHLSPFHRIAAASTLTPQHTLSRQSVCQRGSEMDCVYAGAMNKGGKEEVSWETWVRKREDKRPRGEEEGERGERYEGVRSERKFSETSGKEKESLGRGGNYSCPTMIHWGKFSTSPSPPFRPATSLPNPLTSLSPPYSLYSWW